MERIAVKSWLTACLMALACACALPALAFAATDDVAPALATGQAVVQPQAEESQAEAPTAGLTLKASIQGGKWKTYASAVAAGKVTSVGNALKGKQVSDLKVSLKVDGKSALTVSKRVTGKKKAKKLEWFSLKLTQDAAQYYDITYRANVKGTGWQPWVVNGAKAGGAGKQVLALQVKLVKRGSGVSVSEGTYFISLATSKSRVLSSTTGGATKVDTKFKNNLAERFYVRNEGGGTISLQSVNSGKYLAWNGKLAQQSWSQAKKAGTYKWRLANWDGASGGGMLVNVESGQGIVLDKSGRASMAETGSNVVLSSTQLIPDASFHVKNVRSGAVMAVKDRTNAGSINNGYKIGENIMMQKKNGKQKKGQSFIFTLKASGNVYEIKNAYSYQALDIASKKSGANVSQQMFDGSKAQRWVATLEREGSLVFKNKASGKMLAAAGNARSGKNVAAKSKSGASNQRWKLSASTYAVNPAIPLAAKKVANYASRTKYMLTIDYRNHWVCAFKGSKGNWTLIRSWVVSLGKRGNSTPTGDFETYKHQASSIGGSSIYNWTYFRSLNAFHSVKYKPHSKTQLNDGRLNQNISHGCVRCQLPNAEFVYHLPLHTHVRSYRR